MNCIYLLEAHHIKDFKIFLKFSTGESAEVDLKETIFKHNLYVIPKPFQNFILIHGQHWLGNVDLMLLRRCFILWLRVKQK